MRLTFVGIGYKWDWSVDSELDSGLWTLNSTIYMFCIEKCKIIEQWYNFPIVKTLANK